MPARARSNIGIRVTSRSSSQTRPLSALHQSDHHVEGSRLAGPVAPQQADDLALLHLQGDAVHHPAAAIALDQVLGGGCALLAGAGRRLGSGAGSIAGAGSVGGLRRLRHDEYGALARAAANAPCLGLGVCK